jgi:hypothetical protein
VVELQMALIRQAFFEFSKERAAELALYKALDWAGVTAGVFDSSAIETGPSDERVVAVAWYWDGEREELTEKSFAQVSSHSQWLVQVLSKTSI